MKKIFLINTMMVLISLATFGWGNPVKAQTYNEVVDQAYTAYDAGDFKTSAKLFEKVYNIEASIGMAYNVARSHHQHLDAEGRKDRKVCLAARDWYRKATRTLHVDEDDRKIISKADKRLKKIACRQVTITPSSKEPGAEIWIKEIVDRKKKKIISVERVSYKIGATAPDGSFTWDVIPKTGKYLIEVRAGKRKSSHILQVKPGIDALLVEIPIESAPAATLTIECPTHEDETATVYFGKKHTNFPGDNDWSGLANEDSFFKHEIREIKPGAYLAICETTTMISDKKEITVTAGEQLNLSLELKVKGGSDVTVDPIPTAKSWKTPLVLGASSLAVIALGTGLVLDGINIGNHNDLDDLAAKQDRGELHSPSEANWLLGEVDDNSSTANIMYASSAAFAITAGAIWLWYPDLETNAADAPSVTISPLGAVITIPFN